MNSSKDKLVGSSSFMIQPPTRNTGAASATMRKYQQLALAIVSVISLMAFLFYKHEYDRLRYTLEYLEMFGNVPANEASSALCGSNTMRKLNTAPHYWITLSDDFAIYSTFWDEGNRLTTPVARTLGLLKHSSKHQVELSSVLLFETVNDSVNAVCNIKEIKQRIHVTLLNPNSALKIVNVVCKAEKQIVSTPFVTQFKIGNEDLSSPVLIQESESWKSVANVSCVCVYSPNYPIANLKLIEFIAYYNILGVEKFMFYGYVLTPLVRKLLDKYGDETNIFYEEKLFTLPKSFTLSDNEIRTVIETDCMYRHRDVYENVLVLKLNEFLIPRTKNALHEVLTAVSNGNSASVSEFHFVSQKVCLDHIHLKDSNLLLGSQIQSMSVNKESGVALIRPHLIPNEYTSKTPGIVDFLHVPSSVANIYSFEVCNNDNIHSDTDHLPTNTRFVNLIEKSLLYRKWKIYY